MGRYDFIPAGKEERGGRLVNKRDDPYVIIQQLTAKVADLQRRIDQGENQALQEGNKDLRTVNGELAKKFDELTKEYEGLKLFLSDVTKERDELRSEHGMILKKLKESKNDLPPVTVDMEKMAALQKENLDLKDQIDAAKKTEEAYAALLQENSKLKKNLAQYEPPKKGGK